MSAPWLVAGLALLLCGATLGQGGASPRALLIWHAWLVVLVVGSWFLSRCGAASPRRLPTAPRTAFLVFLALVVVGAGFVPYRYAAWLVLLELGAFAAAAGLAARVGPRLVRRLEWPLLLAAVAQSAVVLAQALGSGTRRAAGTFLNPNHLGSWLAAVLLLVGGAALLDRSRGAGQRAGIAVLGVLPLLALFRTGSRGAWLGFLVGAAVVAVVGWRGWSPLTRRVALIGVLGLGLAAGFVVVQRLGQADPFRYQRLRIWKASLQPALASPLGGTGPGQFSAAARNLQFPDGVLPLRYDRSFSTSHSDWVRLPAELGWPAALALVVALVLAARRRRAAGAGGDAWAAEAGAAAALVALLTHAAVDNLSQRPAIYLLAAVLLGARLSVERETRALPARGRRELAAVLLVMLFLVGDVAPYDAWQRMSPLPQGRLTDAAAAELGRAQQRNPIHPDAWMRRARHIAGDGTDWDLDGYARARESFEHALRLQPADATYRLQAAQLEALACRTLFRDVACRERASAAFERAAELARLDPVIPVEQAKFLLDMADPAGARRAAERALALEPDSVLPRLLLADALIKNDSADLARVARLAEEARVRAERWADWRGEAAYSSELMALEPRVLGRIERRLAAERAVR